MRRAGKRGTVLLAGVTAAAMAIAMFAPAAPAASTAQPGPGDHTTTGGFQPAPIAWQPCPERPADPGVRCGELRLPVNWAHPNGPSFELAVAKHTATSPVGAIGPLVINPGGPGGSGVDFALDAASYFSTNILAHFDIIGFDPRGVGRSSPIECSASLVHARPFPVPASEAGYRALLAYNAKLGADCRAHSGPLFGHVDTASVDRDIDAIRAALGAHQISYYGVSYGTLIGQEYAELFPNRIRAMVIDSNMDHSLHTAAFLDTEAATDEDSFNQFVDWCDRDSTCVLHGKDVPAIWDELMRRADAGALTIPGTTQKVTWFELTSYAVNNFYGPTWSSLAKGISGLYQQKPGPGLPAARPASTGLVPYPVTVFCEDWSLPASSYRQLRDDFASTEALAPHLRTSSLGWGVFASCLNFPAPVNDPQHRLHVRAGVPLLEPNSVHDPATPYLWALDDAGQLGRHGRLVTYLGWGHGVYRHSDCTTGTVDSYLIARTLPPPGAFCPAVPPPDQPTVQAPQVTVPGTPPVTPGFTP